MTIDMKYIKNCSMRVFERIADSINIELLYECKYNDDYLLMRFIDKRGNSTTSIIDKIPNKSYLKDKIDESIKKFIKDLTEFEQQFLSIEKS